MSTARKEVPDPFAEEFDDRCDNCGEPLRRGQEWCLECGAARTLIHRPPDWRVPVAIVALVVAIALAAVVFALLR